MSPGGHPRRPAGIRASGSSAPGAPDGTARSALGTPRRSRRAPCRSGRPSLLHPSCTPLALILLCIDTARAANWAGQTAQFAVEAVSTRAGRQEGESDDRSHDRNTRGVARSTRGAPQAGEGAHQAGRRDRPAASGSALGAGGEGLPVRDGRRGEVARRVVRREVPAARLPLHVRSELRGWLPDQLVDRRLDRRRRPAPPRA